MRITTKMINDSFRRAGLPIHQNSLMNYINNNAGAGIGGLADIMPSKTKGIDSKTKEKYEKREKTADELFEHIEKLVETGEKSLFEKCRESGDASPLYKEVEGLVDTYNSLLKDLHANADTLDAFYSQSMQDLVTSQKELLAEVGISSDKDGKMTIDQDKMKAASIDKLQEAFGGKSDFMAKLLFLSDRVADYAAANIKNASGSYSQNGSMNFYSPSKYNFRG